MCPLVFLFKIYPAIYGLLTFKLTDFNCLNVIGWVSWTEINKDVVKSAEQDKTVHYLWAYLALHFLQNKSMSQTARLSQGLHNNQRKEKSPTWGVNLLLHRYSFGRINNRQLLKTLWENKKIARNEQFLLFPQCFLLNQILVSSFFHIFHIISLFPAEFEEPIIGIRGKELRSNSASIQNKLLLPANDTSFGTTLNIYSSFFREGND